VTKFLLAVLALVVAAPASADVATGPTITLTRLDCGTPVVKDFNTYFSDTLEYPSGPKRIADSCYLIRRFDKYLLWDTGFPASFKGAPHDLGEIVVSLSKTIPEQLAELGLKPSDIAIVGISHMHGDHTGQAADFPNARLVIGKADFELSAGAKDPFKPWRGEKANVTLASHDVDIFGDGSVIALHTPGHTPDHLSLLVKLASGPVLISGDLYHAQIAREKRGMPPFNSSRAETLASMDRFERLAKVLHAKVIIPHEPADIAKLPAFPKAAQ
jgi:glyoxylase-like metal-dependent hydrolase (beta-lactamase superfamily II)